jgi:hypothetical protein
MDKQHTLSGFLDVVWDQMVRGALQNRHDFHWPVVATTNGKQARARTVVLREASRNTRTLWMYSDRRAGKMKDIAEHPQMEWCFFSKRHMLQVRATGPVVVLTEGAQVDEIWKNLPAAGRMNYSAAFPPGSAMSEPGTGLPLDWDEAGQKELGKENFALIGTQLDVLDCLHLHREGHYRARFEWAEDWKGTWVVP